MVAGLAPLALMTLNKTAYLNPEMPYTARMIGTVLILSIVPMCGLFWAGASFRPVTGLTRIGRWLSIAHAVFAAVFSFAAAYSADAPIEVIATAAVMALWVFVGSLRFATASPKPASVWSTRITAFAMYISAFGLMAYSAFIDVNDSYSSAPRYFIIGLWMSLSLAAMMPPMSAYTSFRLADGTVRWWLYPLTFLAIAYFSIIIGGVGYETLHPLLESVLSSSWAATAVSWFVCLTLFFTQWSLSMSSLRKPAPVPVRVSVLVPVTVPVAVAPAAPARRTSPTRPPTKEELRLKRRAENRARNDELRRRRQNGATIPGQEVSRALMDELRSGTCVYCGSPASHADHVRPLSRGGWHHELNLVSACEVCNTHSKHSKLLVEWAQERPDLVLHGILTNPLVMAAYICEMNSLTALHFRYPASSAYVQSVCEKWDRPDLIVTARVSEVPINREPLEVSGVPLPPIDNADTLPEVNAPEPRQWAAIGKRKAKNNNPAAPFPDLHAAWKQWNPTALPEPVSKELELASA